MAKGNKPWTAEEIEFLRTSTHLSTAEVATNLGRSVNSCEHKRYRLGIKSTYVGDPQEVPTQEGGLRKALSQSQERVAFLEREILAFKNLDEPIKRHVIPRRTGTGDKSESVAVLVLSDWHLEQKVIPARVHWRNEHDLEIGKKRQERVINKAVDLVRMFERDTRIDRIVVAMLGDFINGRLHEESAENNLLTPIEATIEMEERLLSSIDFLLEHTDKQLFCVCHSGNHARITKKIHFGSEAGNSLEYAAYRHLERHYRGESRVEFQVPLSPYSFVDILGLNTRFSHGNGIKYSGGVGGVTIGINKQIPRWNNQVDERVHLDVFGHWHQEMSGPNWVSNGSTVGFDGYAIHNGLGYEVPKQAFFLVHEDLGKTISAPIILKD